MLKKWMHILAKIVPNNKNLENSIGVNIYSWVLKVKQLITKTRFLKKSNWPVVSGNYRVINPLGQIAVCTLTSNKLTESIAKWERVSIIGTLYTPNLGIERIILNTISNPNIRYLLLCGKDSPVFQAGQALRCLFDYGITSEKRIINATGHYPVLQNLSITKIHHFLKQIELIDERDVLDTDLLVKKSGTLENKNSYTAFSNTFESKNEIDEEALFVSLKPLGKKIPLAYDEKGFFVITVNSARNEIIVKHYFKDNLPGYIIKSHSSDALLRAIIENNLISQMSHAAYLGAELTKAKIALKNNFQYIQDQPL